ncbi:Aste57867_11380 [Aphanomyces stellatus]|uniref:Aste57867_11380 protein n=1 Tax=Aphanomyces stellatus TaxID=120398 RepID=A0A485KSU1_9STRA|nr:hypothetical protein As57867_011338 [Aphanomyces stellatus]VFT88241.1 Aste57867_11380 [Aphanomyces stellatus]
MFPKLMAVQNDVSSLPDHMNDPRMGKALVALLQASVYATACPVIGSVAELVDHLLVDPAKEWPLWDDYVLLSVPVKESGHPIFVAKNKRRPGDNLVVKLSLGRHEIDFFSRIHQMPNVQHAIRGFVKYIDGAEVQVDSFRCHALILERGTCNGLEGLPFLSTKRLLRYNFIDEVVKAIQGCHNLNHIHGDVKLDNIMFFVADFGGATQYKLIDFDNATRVGKPMNKHCTPEYCPPEMAKFKLGLTTAPVISDTSYDVWCTAVLILKLYSEGGTLIEFAQMNDDKILAAIAAPEFNFERSLNAIVLKDQQKECLVKCLEVNPANRGSLRDFFALLPVTVTATTKNKTNADLEGLMEEIHELKARLKALHMDVNNHGEKTNEMRIFNWPLSTR